MPDILFDSRVAEGQAKWIAAWVGVEVPPVDARSERAFAEWGAVIVAVGLA